MARFGFWRDGVGDLDFVWVLGFSVLASIFGEGLRVRRERVLVGVSGFTSVSCSASALIGLSVAGFVGLCVDQTLVAGAVLRGLGECAVVGASGNESPGGEAEFEEGPEGRLNPSAWFVLSVR